MSGSWLTNPCRPERADNKMNAIYLDTPEKSPRIRTGARESDSRAAAAAAAVTE
jgi:hypothetical protein